MEELGVCLIVEQIVESLVKRALNVGWRLVPDF
jgi:hypothetical protein